MEIKYYSDFLKRIWLTFDDLIECNWCINYLRKEKSNIIEKYLVIAYTRPFSKNDKFDLPPESRNDFNKNEIEIHNKLLNLRNKIIAHSSFELSNMTLSIFCLKSNKDKKDMTAQTSTEDIKLSKELNTIESMVNKLQVFCNNKRIYLRNKLPAGIYER